MSTFYLYLLFCLYYRDAFGCQFEGLLASCKMMVGGIPIQVSARINHCRIPMDVTFSLRSPRYYNVDEHQNEPIRWDYTLITTNSHPETKEIPGYGRRISLHLFSSSESPTVTKVRRLNVDARFSVDGQTDKSLIFLQDMVSLPNFEECLQLAQQETHIIKIASGMFVTIIIACLIGITAVIMHKNRRMRSANEDDEINLVSNMESTDRNLRPTPDLNVHYVARTQNEERIHISTSTDGKPSNHTSLP